MPLKDIRECPRCNQIRWQGCSIPCPKRICAARKAVQVARTATNTPQEGVSDG